MFVEAIEAILTDHCTPATVRAIEEGASCAPLWDALAGAGFLDLFTPEGDGGAGLGLDEVYPVMVCLGRFAVPAPVAQSIAARALLAPHGVKVPDGMVTFAPAIHISVDGRVSCPRVPFGAVADWILAEHDDALLVLDCRSAARILSGVRGSQCANLSFETIHTMTSIAGAGASLHTFGAAIHAALLVGAMGRVFDLSLQYGNDRTQFGKSIGKFQVIQHQLAVMAQHFAAAGIAAELAFTGDSTAPHALAAAIAKARTSEAVVALAAGAHAVHGAIGVTEEYDLQLYTRRLHEWRMAHGSEIYWHRMVGEVLLASDNKPVVDFVRHAIPAQSV